MDPTFSVCGPTNVNHMDQRIGVPQIIQEFVSQSLALVCPGHEPCHIEKLNWNRSSPFDTASVIWLAAVDKIMSAARTLYLQIAYGSLRIDSGESMAE